MKSKKITLSLIVILCAFSVEAKMYKCTDSKGNISYGVSSCKEDKNEKEIKKPYFNEETQQEQVAIVADRKSDLEANNLEKETTALRELYVGRLQYEFSKPFTNNKAIRDLQNAIQGIDDRRAGIHGATGSSTRQMEIEMQDQMDTQEYQMEGQMRRQMQVQKSQMENKMRNEMHRMETQQRLMIKGY
jgi:hypothetical protein